MNFGEQFVETYYSWKEKEESETATVERTMAWDSMDEVIHFSFLR